YTMLDTHRLTGIGISFLSLPGIHAHLPHYTLPAVPLLALLLARNCQTTAARGRSLFPLAVLITAGVWIAIALLVPPIVARFFPAYQLCQQSRASLQPKMHFASVEFEEPSLVWYFRSRVKGF